jgi:phospholipase/carboxylesterase
MGQNIVVFLHGIGGSAQNFERTKSSWEPLMSEAHFISLQGTQKYDKGEGFQWYSTIDISEYNREERIILAREPLDKMLQYQLEKHHFSARYDKLILVGFSQGAIMALDMLVTQRFPLAGVVSFSGRLVTSTIHPDAHQTSAMLIHGLSDPVVAWQSSENAASCLQKGGGVVKTFYEPCLTHKLSNAGKSAAGNFVSQLIYETLS